MKEISKLFGGTYRYELPYRTQAKHAFSSCTSPFQTFARGYQLHFLPMVSLFRGGHLYQAQAVAHTCARLPGTLMPAGHLRTLSSTTIRAVDSDTAAVRLNVPTPSQQNDFDRKGFVIVKSVVPLSTVTSVCTALDACFKGDFETGIYPDEWHWRAEVSRPEGERAESSMVNHLIS